MTPPPRDDPGLQPPSPATDGAPTDASGAPAPPDEATGSSWAPPSDGFEGPAGDPETPPTEAPPAADPPAPSDPFGDSPPESDAAAGPACPQCGEPALPGARFCVRCGAQVTGAGPADALAPPPDLPPTEPPAPGARSSTTTLEEAPDGPSGDGAPRSRLLLTAGIIVVVVAVLSAGAVLIGRRIGSDRADGPPTPTTTTAAATTIPADWVTYNDPVAGFSIDYPPHWPVLDGRDPGGRSLEEFPRRLVLDAGDMNSVLVRVNPLEQAVSADNIGDLKTVTDDIINDSDVVVLDQQRVKHKDLEGYYYLYTFKDPDSGEEGAHLHYFLFKGHRMYSLVFQALPTAAIDRLEGIFNQVLSTFTVP